MKQRNIKWIMKYEEKPDNIYHTNYERQPEKNIAAKKIRFYQFCIDIKTDRQTIWQSNKKNTITSENNLILNN